MLSLVYILCDSIYKDIGQFKSDLPISLFDSCSSFNQLYILFTSKVWRNLKEISTVSERMVYFILRVYYIFILRPSSIGRGERYKKMETLYIYFMDRCWETAESYRNFRFFFFTRKIYFLLTSNLLVIKTDYFFITFLSPSSDAIIGFEK